MMRGKRLTPAVVKMRDLTRRLLSRRTGFVALSGADQTLLGHYMTSGDRDGRSPHILFDPTWYRAQVPKLGRSETALSHYIREGDAAGLTPHPLFRPEWYRTQVGELARGETTLWHYLREGDAAGLSPHPLFDPTWYRGQAPHLEPDANTLVHYLEHGDRASLSPHSLFDPRLYLSQRPARLGEETLLGHYLREGDSVGLRPHPLFDPSWYRWQCPDAASSENALVHLLTRSKFDVPAYRRYLSQAPQSGVFGPDDPFLRLILGLPKGRALAAVPAPLRGSPKMTDTNRLRRVMDVAPAVRADKGKLPPAWSAPARMLPRRPISSTHTSRIIVYTCCYGRYEALKEPASRDPNARFIAFTDDPNLRSENWEICVLNDHLDSARRTSRLPKILPHLFLPDHDISIYIDASLEWQAPDAAKMAAECLENEEIALYRHSKRNCVFDEMDVCGSVGIEHPEVLAFYREHYAALGVPRRAGLYENGLIVRRNTAAVRELNEAWWRIYRGQRDQLALISAIHTTGTRINAIQHGKQVRTNPYVSYVKHDRAALPFATPKLYVFIAYAPPGYHQDLGRTYNEYMQLIEDDAYALFLDHDAMFCSPDWSRLVRRLMTGYSDTECLIVGRTNRIGNPYQRVGLLADEHRASTHRALAQYLEETQRDWVSNVSRLESTSGVVLMLSKRTWKKFPFSRGFLKVDNRMHIAFRESGRPVFMPSSLYVYHFYRADGDVSHAVQLDDGPNDSIRLQAPTENGGGHHLKNFVYDEAGGLDLAHYSGLLVLGEWAIFLRADAIFCDKSWYARAYRQLDRLTPDTVVLFSSNLVDGLAPASDDILEHRVYATGCVQRGAPLVGYVGEPSPDEFVAFMVSKELLDRLVQSGGRTISDLARVVHDTDCKVLRDPSTHVFTQTPRRFGEVEAPAPLTHAQFAEVMRRRRRVAILTLGFWPAQAGMELMIHNLAMQLTKAGDLVTLYAPRPTKPFEEISHSYLLKRFRSEQHFYEMFRRQQSVMPVDVILVQGGFEAASMALTLKEELGVPVVLRTHGEDIQIDESTGYGYRRDQAKKEMIERNIRSVDHNVVIGEHIAPLVRQVAPEIAVTTIHNGVDVDRFRPQHTRHLRDRLGLADDRRILLTVGRNVKKKAFHLAVHALKSVLARVPNAVLVHVGREGNGENLGQIARSLGIERSFYQLGEVNYFETPLIYASADLFVFPSKVETFGNVTVEALSSGLPCVEFDYSVNRQKIASGRNGYVVPFGEVTALADRIVELLLDGEKHRAFSVEARRAAVESFSWERVAERYRDVFQQFRSTEFERQHASTGYGTAPLVGDCSASAGYAERVETATLSLTSHQTVLREAP